jgi:hypothetical protein
MGSHISRRAVMGVGGGALVVGALATSQSAVATGPAGVVHFLDFFRYGPNVDLWGDGTRKNALDKPVLIHEISSCEPVYSWNVYQSWGSGDREHYLEGMYSLLAGGMSPQTHIPFEHRTGMSSVQGVEGTVMWLIRNAVIDDSIVVNQLHLLRMCPPAWLSTTQTTSFTSIPTYFGPVGVQFTQTAGNALSFTWSATWRQRPQQVVLYFPPTIQQITVNGSQFSLPSTGNSVVIPTV